MWVGGALAHGVPRQVELERRSLPQPPVKQVGTLQVQDVSCHHKRQLVCFGLLKRPSQPRRMRPCLHAVDVSRFCSGILRRTVLAPYSRTMSCRRAKLMKLSHVVPEQLAGMHHTIRFCANLARQARLRTADGGEVAYLRLHFFASETTRAVQAALLAGEQDGVDGYILDLRNNPGDRRDERRYLQSCDR